MTRLDRSTQIGRAVGWKVEFPALSLAFDQSGHYAAIEANLPSGLAAGSYRIDIEAMTTADFRKLAMAWQPARGETQRPPLKMILTLFWRDRVGDRPSAARAPATAVLAVTNLARTVSGTRIHTVIEAQEWVHDKLSRAALSAGVSVAGVMPSAEHVLRDAGLDATEYLLHPDPAPEQTEGFEMEAGVPALDLLDRIGERMAERSGRRGRGVYLIRDGKLHVGAYRPIPFAPATGESAAPYPLTAAEGLVSAVSQGARQLTAAERRRAAETGVRTPQRESYLLTALGRPDLKPGDVVTTTVDTSDKALFGGFGLPDLPGAATTAQVELYVISVQHRIGKNQGWTTTATALTVDTSSGAQGVWDMAAPAEAGSSRAGGSDPDAADPAQTIVHHIRAEAQAVMRIRERPRTGEVRANHQKTETAAGAVTTAAQSLDLMVGLEVPDGQPRRARRQELRRTDELRRNIPYLTPFAWGPYGLVLPHYPGERVLVDFHEDSVDDPVVVGAFWQTAGASDAAAPSAARPGDWWLILPAALAASARGSAPGSDPVSLPQNAKAVHDLIDADGARIIQMKELTIRILPEGDLGPPQTRPGGGAEGGVLITHKNGAMIRIDAQGAITIEAKTSLTLKAAEDVTIEGANIKLKGNSVDVQ